MQKYLKQYLVDGATFYHNRAVHKKELAEKRNNEQLLLDAREDEARADAYLEMLDAVCEHKFLL